MLCVSDVASGLTETFRLEDSKRSARPILHKMYHLLLANPTRKEYALIRCLAFYWDSGSARCREWDQANNDGGKRCSSLRFTHVDVSIRRVAAFCFVRYLFQTANSSTRGHNGGTSLGDQDLADEPVEDEIPRDKVS